MLDQLTLLIPTHNRHRYLNRLLDYYNETPFNIVVCDSTEVPFDKIADYPNVIYHHYPATDYMVKMNDVLSKINTQRLLLCADDDFIVPEAIYQCLDFLEKHPDYSTVLGNYISFKNEGGNIRTRLMYTHVCDVDICHEKASERIEAVYNNYFQTFYSIHFTSTVKMLFKLCAENAIQVKLNEKLFSMLAIINGKIRILPIFYSVREAIEDSGSTRYVDLDVICRNEAYEQDYQTFITLSGNYLAEKEGIDVEHAKAMVFNAFDAHIEELIHKRKKAQATPTAVINKGWKEKVKTNKLVSGIYRNLLIRGKIKEEKKAYENRHLKYGVKYKEGGKLYFTNHEEDQQLERVKTFILKHNI